MGSWPEQGFGWVPILATWVQVQIWGARLQSGLAAFTAMAWIQSLVVKLRSYKLGDIAGS